MRRALIGFVLGAAAAAGAAPAVAQRSGPPDLVWPAPPEDPRIRYLGAVNSEADIGRRESFVARLSRALLGRGRTPVLRLERPFDMFAADSTRMYVTNGLIRAVLQLDRSARRARLLGSDVPGGFGKPMGLGGDARGNVYVADAASRRVVVLGPDGAFSRAIGGGGLLLNPVDVAVDDATGRVYVVDSYLHQVVVFDSSGRVHSRIGRQMGTLVASTPAPGPSESDAGSPPHGGRAASEPSDDWRNRGGEPGEFRYPMSAAVGPDGTLYVTDQMNFRVQAFDRNGRFVRQFGRIGDTPGTFTRPKGVAVDGEGHVYVVDAAFNNVQVFDGEGRLLIAFGSLGRGPGEHWLPVGIAVDRNNRIYVADRYNNRVQMYQYLPEPAAPALAGPAGPQRAGPH